MKMAYRENLLLRDIIRFCFEWQDLILQNYFPQIIDLLFYQIPTQTLSSLFLQYITHIDFSVKYGA